MRTYEIFVEVNRALKVSFDVGVNGKLPTEATIEPRLRQTVLQCEDLLVTMI